MIATPQQFSVLIEELGSSAWTLAAIGALFESGLAEQLREPRSVDELAARCPALTPERIERCLAVAAVRGVVGVEEGRFQLAPGVLPSLEPGPRRALAGDWWSYLLQPGVYLSSVRAGERAQGWRHTDPNILQAQGDASTMFASALKAHLAPELGDLGARLERPGARFLDVGVGVASLSIAMCQNFPQLSAVGLDPNEVPLGLARANVARAGLGDRIELRQTTIQEIGDDAVFDLAWLPTFFLVERDAVKRAMERIATALRPGGWILTPTMNPAAGEAQRALWSLVMEAWGGPVLFAPEAEAMLAEAGLKPRVFSRPTWLSMVVAQRPL